MFGPTSFPLLLGLINFCGPLPLVHAPRCLFHPKRRLVTHVVATTLPICRVAIGTHCSLNLATFSPVVACQANFEPNRFKLLSYISPFCVVCAPCLCPLFACAVRRSAFDLLHKTASTPIHRAFAPWVVPISSPHRNYSWSDTKS